MNANNTTRKVSFVRLIVKAYFVTALAISFSHFIHAFNKLGLYGFGAVSMPIAIDGLAVVGMILQGKDFSKATNKIGKWMQLICGTISLSVNIFSGWGAAGAIIQGITWVTIYMVLEVVVGKIQPASIDTEAANAAAVAEAEAIAAAASAWLANCTHPTTCTTPEQCATKIAAADKRRKTTKAKARKANAEKRMLESMVNA